MLAGMDAANPYAPPQASLSDGVEGEIELPAWRLEGRTLIARNGATLPDICLFTGAATTAGQRVQMPMSWTPPWFRIIAVFAPVLAIFAYGLLRKSSIVELGLSQAGRRRRWFCALLTLGAVIDGLALIVVGSDWADGGRETTAGFLLFCFLALVFAALFARVFRVVKIDRRATHLVLREPVAAAFARLPAPR